MRGTLRTALLKSALAVLLLSPAAASAHGVWGHVHVTGWAIENLPVGDVRDFFAEPEVMNAALFGAAFTDSGYAIPAGTDIASAARAFGEHTHWEPFIQDFVQWIEKNDPPPWTTLESKKRVAFLMGCAAHGLQDEIFDSLFLFQVKEHDGGSQDNADPASDGFLVVDGHQRFLPEPWVPMETLLELYADLDAGVTAEVIDRAVLVLTGAYINDTLGLLAAKKLEEVYGPDLPWMRAHYLDPNIPGSLRAEINPTLHYMEALWKRLHGELLPGDTIISTYPESPRRLIGGSADSPDSWVTVVYGIGVHADSLKATWTADAGGASTDVSIEGTRWGATWTRLHRIQPKIDVTSGDFYTVDVAPGQPRIDGVETTAATSIQFQVSCETEGDPACADQDIEDPTIDEPEPEPEPVIEEVNAAEPSEPVVAERGAASPEGCSSSGAPGRGLPGLAFLFALGGLACMGRRRAGA